MRAMEDIKAGTFWVNDPLTDNDAGPFGGMRFSGMGRELGEEGLDAFREPKHVHIDYVMEKKSYWLSVRGSSIARPRNEIRSNWGSGRHGPDRRCRDLFELAESDDEIVIADYTSRKRTLGRGYAKSANHCQTLDV